MSRLKTAFEPDPNPNDIPLGPQQTKKTPKLVQYQKSEFNGAYKIQLFSFMSRTKKHFEPYLNPKNNPLKP